MSRSFSLDKRDLSKIAKGALVAAVGVVLTGTTELITQAAANRSLGNYAPYVVAAWSVVANAVRKFVSDTGDPSGGDS